MGAAPRDTGVPAGGARGNPWRCDMPTVRETPAALETIVPAHLLQPRVRTSCRPAAQHDDLGGVEGLERVLAVGPRRAPGNKVREGGKGDTATPSMHTTGRT